MSAIFLKHGGTYVSMTEQSYDAESVLQELIQRHPEMLAGEDARGRLLLVKREAGVNDREDGGARWSLDHLYLDAEGVPTLVEVKRSSDTRGRREVVAQMLDYAANAKTSFSVERMATWLEEDSQQRGSTAAQALRTTFGVDDAEGYWETVAKNMDAQRFRLIFVSDVIGSELRKIIEFLNGQMARTEVLAIEVKQYVAGDHQTIVPRVIGETQDAKDVKRPGRGPHFDCVSLLALLDDVGAEPAEAATALLDWAANHPQLEITYGHKAVADIRFAGRIILRVRGKGTLEVTLRTLSDLEATWNSERIEELVQRIEAIDGVLFLSASRNWPQMELAPLADASKRQQFTAIVEDVLRALDLQT